MLFTKKIRCLSTAAFLFGSQNLIKQFLFVFQGLSTHIQDRCFFYVGISFVREHNVRIFYVDYVVDHVVDNLVLSVDSHGILLSFFPHFEGARFKRHELDGNKNEKIGLYLP
jgi:hypothetical protein